MSYKNRYIPWDYKGYSDCIFWLKIEQLIAILSDYKSVRLIFCTDRK